MHLLLLEEMLLQSIGAVTHQNAIHATVPIAALSANTGKALLGIARQHNTNRTGPIIK